jgi:hypothetical protein
MLFLFAAHPRELNIQLTIANKATCLIELMILHTAPPVWFPGRHTGKEMPFDKIGQLEKAPVLTDRVVAWDVVRPNRPLIRVVARGSERKANSITIFIAHHLIGLASQGKTRAGRRGHFPKSLGTWATKSRRRMMNGR